MAKQLEGYERYRQFMDRLTESNVDDYINLPMIAVMGDTSSGKSSLLSNISLVDLPSADSLTTRCPIMLKMHNAASRSACVKVSWKEQEGAEFAERKIVEENWDSITGAIADAQAHIIKISGKEVSRDIVSVDVYGPHCENLTLIDLPGIVRTAGKQESATLAEDIQGLMNDYLSNNRCVILAVLPCNVDFHNSQILAEARKVDPDTKRTIPVLTKPDLIDDGGEMSVKELLLGMKTDSFSLGFHMVKGRGQSALNKKESIEQGLNTEQSFFDNTEPWRGVTDKNLVGTKSLRVKLAELQMHLIRSSFKGIEHDLKAKRDEASLAYQELGKVPTNLSEKKSLFQSMKEVIWKEISSKTLEGRFSLHCGSLPSAKFLEESESFQGYLNSSKLANISAVKVGSEVIVIYDQKEVFGEVMHINEADEVYLKEIVTKNVPLSSMPSMRLEKEKPGAIVVSTEKKVYLRLGDANDTCVELTPIERVLVRPNPEWIKNIIRQNRPYELPIFTNANVFKAIVADLIKNEWTQPAIDLLDSTSKLMYTAAEDFIKEAKLIASFPVFQSFLSAKASEVVEDLTQEARNRVEEFVEREKVPYTQNHYLFENVCKLRSQRLKDEVISSLPSGTSNVSVNPESLAAIVENVFTRNQERSNDEYMAEEMQHYLNGYGKVALKRFIDSVPMICIEIMQKFPDRMNNILSKTTDEEIERIVVNPPNVVSTRNTLKRKVDTLEKGIVALRDLF